MAVAPAVLGDVASGLQVVLGVAGDGGRHPVAGGVGADQQAQPARVHAFEMDAAARLTHLQVEPLQAAIATAADHLGAGAHLDVAGRVDLTDQVLRHGRGQPVAAHDDRDLVGELGQVQGRLPGRVAAADHDDVAALHLPRHGGRGTVVDAAAQEGVQGGHPQPAVGDACGEDDRPGADPGSADEHVMVGGFPGRGVLDVGDRAARVELCPEPQRLNAGALRQPHPRNAAREPQIVADHRTGSGLAADRLRLDDDGVQSLGRRVHRRRQPGRTCADDHHVGDLIVWDRIVAAVHGLGRLRDGRPAEELVVEGPQQRQLGIRAGRLQHRRSLRRVGLIGARGHAGTLQPVPQRGHVRVRPLIDEFDAGHDRTGDRPAPIGQGLDQRGMELLVPQPLRDGQVGVQLVVEARDPQPVDMGQEVLGEQRHPPGGRHERPQPREHVEGVTVAQVVLGGDQRQLMPLVDQRFHDRHGVRHAGGRHQFVVAGVALELPQQGRAVGVGDQHDDGTLTHSSPRGGEGRA